MPSIYSRGPALEVCQTQSCLMAASGIQNYVDFNANPCDDFYQFACGNYIKNAVVDENTSTVGLAASFDENVVNGIASVLSSTYEDLLNVNLAPDFVEGANYSSEADQRVFGLLKSYYASCMDTETIEKEGPIYLYPIFGNIDYASSSDNDIVATRTALTTHVDSIGASALWDATVIPNPAVAGMSILAISPVAYDYLPSFNTSNPDEVAGYKSTLLGIADDIFSSNNTDRIEAAKKASFKLWAKDEVEARVDQVIQFQIAMIQLVDFSTMTDPLDNVDKKTKPLGEIQESYPFVDWETYFRYFVPNDRDVPESIAVLAPDGWLEDLNTLMNGTSLATFSDYLLFHTALKNADESGSYVMSLAGLSAGDRQQTCVDNVRKYWDIPMLRYYAMRFLGGAEMRDRLQQLLTNIHQTWANRLERADWLDDETRANARDKIEKMGQWAEFYTNYPDDRNPSELSEYIGPIEFTQSFGSNQLLTKRFYSVRRNYMDVGKPVNRENFAITGEMNMLETNAFYISLTNYIAILPGIVQHPMYDTGYPAYLNYGGLGYVVGHEFTHGFDTEGRNYDADGLKVNWWTNKTTAIFEEKTNCLVNQYNNMTVEGPNDEWLHVDGTLTLAENVADNGGINAAYEAYTTYWNSGAEKKMSLPGIDLTPDQLFFVNFALFYCSKSTPEYNAELLTTDNHSPDSARVRGTLQNTPEFAKAYNCPVGSYMNPKKKCSVW